MARTSVILLLCPSLFAGASKRRIHVTYDLEDVVYDEEDGAWKEWGTRRRRKSSEDDEFDPLPDFSGMDLGRIQDEMMRRHSGPNFRLMEFLLDQPEAYEVKIGDRVIRRPGDPLLEEVVEQLCREKGGTTQDSEEETKEEL